MKKLAMITGASSGIGAAAAKIFASNGWDVILIGRRTERIKEISEALHNEFGIEALPLTLDVSDQPEVARQLAKLEGKWRELDVLVNNAGGARGLGAIQEGSLNDWEWMINVNLKGLLYISHEVIPMMLKRNKGHIINVGSIAGRQPYPNGNVYCAVKAAVDSISRGMRLDLLKESIKVTHVAPGAANTEFSLARFHGDQHRADSVYNGYQPLTGEDVAEVIYYAASLPPHVNINDIEITPTAQAATTFFNRKG